jgi:nitroreductase
MNDKGEPPAKEAVMEVIEAMESRRSCRVFTDEPVTRDQVEQLLTRAGLAPSAINMQVWECTAVFGDEVRRLGRRLQKVLRERAITCGAENVKPLPQAQIDRQAEAGAQMAPLLDQMGTDIRTFVNQGTLDFYGAPVGLVFYIDSAHPPIRLLDVGVLAGYLFVAAQQMGLATCPLGLLTGYASDIFDQLNIPEDKVMALGVAVGHPDPEAPINRLKTTRAPLDQWVRWYGD